jgi:hypothetical protein
MHSSSSSMCATCPDLIILIMLGKGYKFYNSFCSFLQLPITSSLFGPNMVWWMILVIIKGGSHKWHTHFPMSLKTRITVFIWQSTFEQRVLLFAQDGHIHIISLPLVSKLGTSFSPLKDSCHCTCTIISVRYEVNLQKVKWTNSLLIPSLSSINWLVFVLGKLCFL